MQEVIRVADYEKGKTGEGRLLVDLFKMIQPTLGKDRQQDTLKIVLGNPEIFQIYLETYHRLKEQGVIVLPTKQKGVLFWEKTVEIPEDTPCGKTEKESIDSLTQKVKKRYFAQGILSKEQLEALPDEVLVQLEREQLEALAITRDSVFLISPRIISYMREALIKMRDDEICALKDLTLEQVQEMEPENLAKMRSSQIQALSEIPSELIQIIEGENLAEMDQAKIKELKNLTSELAQEVGGENLLQMQVSQIRALTGVSIDVIQVIGGEMLIKMSDDVLSWLKDKSFDFIFENPEIRTLKNKRDIQRFENRNAGGDVAMCF